MFDLAMILLVIAMICACVGLMKFPWEAGTFQEMSEEQWVRFRKSTGLVLIPLSLAALAWFGALASF